MSQRLIEKKEAVLLRRRGYSYSEIQKLIPNLAKSTLSYWLRNIDLSPKQQKRIVDKMRSAGEKSRQKGAWTNKKKAKDRINKIQEIAESQFAQYVLDPLFVTGVALYWAEGSKKSKYFQFMNSDPKLIQLMLKFIGRFGASADSIKIRIYAHEVYQCENIDSYWLSVVGLPRSNFRKTVIKPSSHSIKKNDDYKGCCRIEVSGSELFWKIVKWQEMLYMGVL